MSVTARSMGPGAGSEPSRPEPDGALAGATAARRLYREIVAAPASPRRIDVVAPAGHGKTVLLDLLADAYRAAGAPVLRALPAELPEDAVLVLDDVHLLPAADLRRVRDIAAARSHRLVVAHRPWPTGPELAALGGAIAGGGTLLVLGALDRPGVAARAARILRERPPVPLVDHVLAQTAGLPDLVDRHLTGILDQIGPADRARLAQPGGIPTRPPQNLVHQLGYAVYGMERRVRELLVALALGAPRDAEVLVPLLGLADAAGGGIDEVDELVEEARSAGHLTADGALPPLVAHSVRQRVPGARRLEVRRTLAEIELDRGGSVLTAARGLLDTGATGARAAEVFVAGADEAARTGDPVAGPLYEAAVAAGAPGLRLAARRAEAAVRAGDLDLALAQADQVLTHVDAVDVEDAVVAGTAAAAVLAHRGLLARSAELYRWMSAVGGSAETGPLAVPALIGTGALEEARALLSPPAPAAAAPQPPSILAPPPLFGGPSPTATVGRPPTLLASAEQLMAAGVLDSVAGSPTRALSQLARSASLLEASNRAALLPDTPAALAALVAIHCGELDVAQSVLDRAVDVELGGPAAVARHQLLLAWIAVFRGAVPTARSLLATASPIDARLEPRDELLAAALEVSIARRAGDLAALMPAWGRAREAIVRHPVDLFVLQPLGELAIAAARLRETSWVRPHLDEAATLLDRLGRPALWSAPLHWSQLHAAIVADDRAAATAHADALRDAAPVSRYATAMADAAPHWVNLMDAEVDADAVEAAARGLHAVGLSWEGGKLAGQAAIRTRDRKAMTALLGAARAMQGGGPVATAPPNAVQADAPEPEDLGEGPLSDREREVAKLVLEGLTYKQVGERLFISAKTVEHHVARMRQRLGSNSRGELFAHLRQIVGPDT
ncbi:helix-turn-helix transcriptional regulator [Pseudonocardia sulfidoxydans NBRC 16205]|uniref:Helix-turn-helix transcriptional regulator n=1 Tax=Pseudonocardia sulfidoxydans NBRC 16205 TaxID=1223511 RepID=A0A511DQC4_9PSEU|nr:LuxR C-terminal-related transcriptional regulator [Pseudonocardia sulfidoxydans]GEL26557.1 helix-turn-helix transcriptional regulator [Pseudonocardia sulfidoxydans NBRC 16205]